VKREVPVRVTAERLYTAVREAMVAEPNVFDVVSDLQEGRVWMTASEQTVHFFQRVAADLQVRK
jgi:hypothetical protein